MSNYVVHFVKKDGMDDGYRAALSILGGQCIDARNPFGIGRKFCPDPSSQKVVCFSEVPPGQWERLVERRETKYGIGFSKARVVRAGGGPIWYAWQDTPHNTELLRMMSAASSDANASIWKLTPLIDAPGEYNGKPYAFEWEREWRHLGSFRFAVDDVAFLFIPETLHEAARSFFAAAESEKTGPAYHCPYIDPTWSRERILQALRQPGSISFEIDI